MKIAGKLDSEKLKAGLEDNKELLLSLCIFLAALGLFIIFILPNILSFPSKKGERDVEVSKLNEIKNAKKVLESSDVAQLSNESDTVSRILPTDKNFELILGGISEAATNSNTQVIGYQFAEVGVRPQTAQGSFPSLDFEISIAGGIDQAAKFSDELSVTYPISEVKSISYTEGVSKVIASFFYKPFTQVNAQDAAIAREKTAKESQTLRDVAGWNSVTNTDSGLTSQTSTESASPF